MSNYTESLRVTSCKPDLREAFNSYMDSLDDNQKKALEDSAIKEGYSGFFSKFRDIYKKGLYPYDLTKPKHRSDVHHSDR